MASDQSRIVALVADTPIRQDDLWDSLIQMSGKKALDDAILDIGVMNELKRRGLVVSNVELETERSLLIETLAVENFDDALELLWSTLSLTEPQVNNLIERNAGLRKLIAEHVTVNDETIERMFQILHGPSAEARIIVCDTIEAAHLAMGALQEGQRFAEVASLYSTDSSRVNRGFLGEVIYADPQWPASLREQIEVINVGAHSKPFLLDTRWVIVNKISENFPNSVKLQDVQDEVAEIAKRAQERLRMDQLSIQILQTYQPSIYDNALEQSLSPNRQ